MAATTSSSVNGASPLPTGSVRAFSLKVRIASASAVAGGSGVGESAASARLNAAPTKMGTVLMAASSCAFRDGEPDRSASHHSPIKTDVPDEVFGGNRYGIHPAFVCPHQPNLNKNRICPFVSKRLRPLKGEWFRLSAASVEIPFFAHPIPPGARRSADG
jgi:hypothetical protein